ncbi:hypothetical protein pb186bvf_002072 [Paramecium bursaria]
MMKQSAQTKIQIMFMIPLNEKIMNYHHKSIKFSPNERIICLHSQQSIILWRISQRGKFKLISQHISIQKYIRSTSFSEDSRSIFTGDCDGRVKQFIIRNQNLKTIQIVSSSCGTTIYKIIQKQNHKLIFISKDLIIGFCLKQKVYTEKISLNYFTYDIIDNHYNTFLFDDNRYLKLIFKQQTSQYYMKDRKVDCKIEYGQFFNKGMQILTYYNQQIHLYDICDKLQITETKIIDPNFSLVTFIKRLDEIYYYTTKLQHIEIYNLNKGNELKIELKQSTWKEQISSQWKYLAYFDQDERYLIIQIS